MSDLNKPGFSGSPPNRPARIAIPPRSFPSVLDDASPHAFDPQWEVGKYTRQVPFSPTSPGKRSPGRPRTTKEYEEDLAYFKRENFNLKIRIYFMEQRHSDPSIPKDMDELQIAMYELKEEHEKLKKDLANKEDLLLTTFKAFETQKNQLETMKTEYDAEKQELLNKIDVLEKELKDYQLKFMETSVHLDDTNAMYAITFGLNNKPGSKKADNLSEERIHELENDLAKEKERVLMLEGMVAESNAKGADERKGLQQLSEQLQSVEAQLLKALEERELYEKATKETADQVTKLEKLLFKKGQKFKEKEDEVESMKSILSRLKEESAKLKFLLQEKEEKSPHTNITQAEYQKQLRSLIVENSNLKHEMKRVHQLLDNRSSSRTLREKERLSGRKSSDQAHELREAREKIEELLKEVESLKSKLLRFNNGTVQTLIQTLMKDNNVLKKEIGNLRKENANLTGNHTGPFKEEVERKVEELSKDMASEKDALISELKHKVEELTESVNEKEGRLQEFKLKLECSSNDAVIESKTRNMKHTEDNLDKQDKEKEVLTKELVDMRKEVESLKKELMKKTYNLQGLVNTELWDKNREIEKLNKVCERKHLEVLTLQKQLRDRELSLVQDKVTSFVSPISHPSGLFAEDKENLQPDHMMQLQHLAEEKRLLIRKVEELESRLLNTPERDTESLLVQTLRAERDQAEILRKQTVKACVMLTTRLHELADFLDSLLPSLGGRKRRVVQQAVERSRELSRSLSLAAEESSLHQCSAWTDLQPSLYTPLLPDISTVDFWSGDECQEEPFSGEEEVARLKSQVETLTEEVKQKDGEIAKFQSEKTFNESFLFKSLLNINEQHVGESNNMLLGESQFCDNIADITEGSLIETCSDQNNLKKSNNNKQLSKVRSANIGRITLTSRKKDANPTVTVRETSKPREADGGMSECETWSEPDRDVSYARMGLTEESSNINKTLQFNFDDTSETADPTPKSPSSRRASEIQRLQRKVRSLEEVNEALRSELVILHKLAPPSQTRQDKATSIEMSRQNVFCVPSHLLEEIRNQREKLEASLFHNDYIRRQLESTVSSLRRSQGDDQEKASFIRLKETMSKLELAETELSKLKFEKEEWNKTIEMLQTTIKQNSNELIEKQCALLDLGNKTSQRLREMEETCNQKCLQSEQKYLQLEQKWEELQKEKDQLLGKIGEINQLITKLSAEVENYEEEGKKSKQLHDDLNLQFQQMTLQKDALQRVVDEQEQLLADAERERQELATQLIARDRQVSELQAQLSGSSELEAALRSQLDTATHQCAQFEAKIRDLDNSSKDVELQRRLDSARFAHSEAVLQYSRVANENIRLQQELRRRQHEPNTTAQLERIKCQLEKRVAELEVVNSELETRLASLHLMKPPYSDCETDGGSSVVGSPRRPLPSPLALPQRSQDLTSDYLSDQDLALSSPQAQTRNMWFPTSPRSHTSSASPDLGIESDHGRFSSLETHPPKSSVVALTGAPVKDLMRLEEENSQLRHNLQKTRLALEETLAQLTAANHHKRHYEAQLSAAHQQKAKVERAIYRQLHKTESIIKKARVNLEEGHKENH